MIGKIQQLEEGGGFCFIIIVCVHGDGHACMIWMWRCMHDIDV